MTVLVVLAVLAMIVWVFSSIEPRQPPKTVILDGDQAHITSLEHELGMCKDAVYVPGEPWLVCSLMLSAGDPRLTWEQRVEAADRAIANAQAVPPAFTRDLARKVRADHRRKEVTNDFGPRNAELWRKLSEDCPRCGKAIPRGVLQAHLNQHFDADKQSVDLGQPAPFWTGPEPPPSVPPERFER